MSIALASIVSFVIGFALGVMVNLASTAVDPLASIVSFVIGFALGVIGNLASTAIERWLFAIPESMIRWFASKLPPHARVAIYEQWRAKLKGEKGHFRRFKYAWSRRSAAKSKQREYAISQAELSFKKGLVYFYGQSIAPDPNKPLPVAGMTSSQSESDDLAKANEHFSHALEELGVRAPRDTLYAYFVWGIQFLWIAYWLGLRRTIRWRRRDREDDDVAVRQLTLETLLYWGRTEVIRSPPLLFWQVVTGLRMLRRVNPRQIAKASTMYAECAAIFAYTGKHFLLAKKLFGVAATLCQREHFDEVFSLDVMRFIIDYLEGNWSADDLITDAVLDTAVKDDKLRWHVNLYLGLKCDLEARQGKFDDCQKHLCLLEALGRDYKPANANFEVTTALKLVEQRRLCEAFPLIEHYYSTVAEPSRRVLALGIKAKIQALLQDIEGAKLTLEMVKWRQLFWSSAWHKGPYWLSKLLVEVVSAGEARAKGDVDGKKVVGAAATKIVKKVAQPGEISVAYRLELQKLKGTVSWLLDDQRSALAIWDQAKSDAKRMGAALELARTRYELGTRLSESCVDHHQTRGRRGEPDLKEALDSFEKHDVPPDWTIGPEGTLTGHS